MTIEARIEKDSVGPNGVRITTFVLSYPRFIHSELMTHRAFSRNASSSRAIPFEKQLQLIKNDTAMPIEFRANQKGMQAGEALSDDKQAACKVAWLEARDWAIQQAELLNILGAHKQYVNRLLEPFAHISVVLTATEFSNFFALRHHSMAQPEIADLAKKMWDLYSVNQPKELEAGAWHLPFVTEEEIALYFNASGDHLNYPDNPWLPLIKRSVARCARVSYNNFHGNVSSYVQDEDLYHKLLGSQPIHASPAEHQAKAIHDTPGLLKWSANFRGWLQFRKTLKDENIANFSGPLG